jgi:hypothetical protein
MAVEGELPARQRLIIGLLVGGLGVGITSAAYLHPEQMRAPAYVVYAATSSFVLAGIALVAGALGARKLVQWLGVLIVMALMTPAVWIALGPGAHDCGFSLGFVAGVAPDLACRLGFGAGALLGLLILVLIVRQALRGTSR